MIAEGIAVGAGIDPPAILTRDFREHLQAVLAQALLVAQAPAPGRLDRLAVSHA